MRDANVPFAVAALLLFVAAGAPSARAEQRPPLTAEESRAATTCLSLIRACQLADGAFAQVAPQDGRDAPVWIAPYFANFAALALLTNADPAHRAEDLARVGRWLDWCAKHQSADGYWNDFEGTARAYADTGKVDAWDSSAALFLLAAARHQRSEGQTAPAVTVAIARALACLARVTDADGLTWATPNHKVKYLMDNVEVRAGLLAAGSPDARAQADRIGKKLLGFWQPATGLYAYAQHADGAFVGGLDKPYPQGLAQLFGVAWIAPKTSAWASVTHAFSPEAGPATSTGTEWWLIAASRFRSDAAKEWRARLVKEVTSFTPQGVYIHRPALAVLGLLEGSEWMMK